MTQSKPAHWKGKFYFRKESGDWREIVNNKVVKAQRSASLEELRNKEGKSTSWEITRSHPYGSGGQSKENSKKAIKLFHQEKSEQGARLFKRPTFKR